MSHKGSIPWNRGLIGAQAGWNTKNPFSKSDRRYVVWQKWTHLQSRCLDKKNPKIDPSGALVNCLLTFEEYDSVAGPYIDNGTFGRGRGKFCVGRNNDLGHYELGNISMLPWAKNSSDGQKGRPKNYRPVGNKVNHHYTEERLKNLSKSLQKPCTIDGIIIFPSRTKLAGSLGCGMKGTKHPNFRYV